MFNYLFVVGSNELFDEPIENVVECKLCMKVLKIVENQLINKEKSKVTMIFVC